MRRNVVVVTLLFGVCAALVARCYLHGSDGKRLGRDHKAANGDVMMRTGKLDPRTQPRASIAGVIRNDAHAPVPHARVCAQAESRELPLSVTREPLCTNADTRGAYAIKDLYPAEYTVSAMAERYPPAQAAPFDLKAAEIRTGVDLELLSGGVEVSGTVSDLEGGPISHARVEAFPFTTYKSSPPVETDDTGAFRLWMWPGNIGISATADGYTASRAWGRAPGTFALSLEIESTLAGTVIDAGSGNPIGGARVTLTTQASVMTGYGPSERSDESGRFRFDRLEAGRYFVIAIGDHRYGRSDGSVLVERGSHVENTIVKVHPAARVEATILVEGSPPKPCPNAWFTLSYGRPDDELWASADTDGSVRIDGVTPGSYTANVGCPGHTVSESAFKLDVGADDVTGLSWKFTKAIGATLRGHVRDSSGLPIAGAHVEAHGDSWGTGTSRSDGSYEINELAGTVSLNVTSPRGVGPRPPWKVTIPATGVVVKDLSLNAGGSIVGTVTDTDGKAVPDIVVTSDFNGQYPEVRTGRDGAFQFDNLPPGELTVLVEEPGAPSQRASVTVRSAEAARANFVVAARRGRITGTVIDDAGKSIGDAFVTAEREVDDETNIAAQVPTGVDGSFTLTPLAVGSYKLTASRAGAGKAVLEHVQIGSKVQIQIKATGSIAGTVRSPDGEITDVIISVDNPQTGVSRRERFYRTGGRYRFEDLPAGVYQVTARSGESEGQLTVELASGARLTGIDLVFSYGGSLTGRVVDLISKQPVSGIKLTAWLQNGQRERVAVSGADGRFRIEDLAIGPSWFSASGEGYASVRLTREVNGANTMLGDIAIVKKRYRRGDAIGRLGVTFGNDAFRVVAIDPTGSAMKSGLVVGDVVTSIDGIDVTSVNTDAALALLTVPVGTTIRLGVARGTSITIVTVAR